MPTAMLSVSQKLPTLPDEYPGSFAMAADNGYQRRVSLLRLVVSGGPFGGPAGSAVCYGGTGVATHPSLLVSHIKSCG